MGLLRNGEGLWHLIVGLEQGGIGQVEGNNRTLKALHLGLMTPSPGMTSNLFQP